MVNRNGHNSYWHVMQKALKASVMIACIALPGMAGATEKASSASPMSHAVAVLQPSATDVLIGDEKAPVTFVEYSSLSCPHCAHFQKDVFPMLKSEYIDKGKMRYVHRDFPLDEPALRGAMLTHCVEKERYYTFVKVLFEKQESWAYAKNYLEILSNIARLGGVGAEKFEQCMTDKKVEEAILQSKLSAVSTLEIKGTPSFFINGERYTGGYDYKQFAAYLNKLLEAPAVKQPK